MRAVRRVMPVFSNEPHDQAGRSATLVLLLTIIALAIQFTAGFDRLHDRSLGSPAGIAHMRANLTVTELTEAGAQTGIQVGDRLRALDDQLVWSNIDYRHTLNRFALGSLVSVVMERAGQEIEIGPVQIYQSDLHVPLFVMRHLVSLTFVAVAAWVGLSRSGVRAAELFFLAALSLGAYYALLTTRDPELIFVRAAVLVLTASLTVHFFLVFPKEWTIIGSRWWPLLYLPTLILLGLMAAAYWRLAQGGVGVDVALERWERYNTVGFVYLAVSGTFGLFALIRSYMTAENAVERRRLQWIMWGVGLASLTAAADLTLTLLGMHTSEMSMVLLLGVVPLPLAFAFSILRYRLWTIDLVLSRSAVYGMLTAILAAVYVFLIGVLSLTLASTTDGVNAAVVLFLSALVIGILANPLRTRIQSMIDRIFFRSAVDHQRVLARWSEELSTSLRFADLAALLLREVPDVLQLERAWLLVLTQDETTLQPIARTGVAADARVPAALSISAHSALAAELGRRRSTTLLYDRPDLAAMHHDVLGQWQSLGVRVLLPLVNGGKLVGVYLLGNKLSGDVYQHADLELLHTLANQSAVAISNARLYEQVHAFSQEMETKVLERTKELRDFVSVVYHELSAPITAVKGFTELLLDGAPGPLTERQARHLDVIKRSAQRLTGLVTDLSDLSKIDDNRLKIHPESMDLEEAVAETLAALSGIIDEKGLQVSTRLATDAAWVEGDPRRVVQILTNLVGNACRYTPAGGRVDICAHRADGLAEVTVSDTGMGIPKEDLEMIFKPFVRGSDPLVQEQPGTGLGLAITRSLVEMHGSKLWVNSTVGKGSTFGFALRVTETVDE